MGPLVRDLDSSAAASIADYAVTPAVEQRMNVLAARANEGAFSTAERAEYEALADAARRDWVSRRAGLRCEYRRFPQASADLSPHVEHIVARKHGSSDNIDNSVLACQRCNLCKGPNLSGVGGR